MRTKYTCNENGCTGYYCIRKGKHGVFAGCSEYPACKSILKVENLYAEMLLSYEDINIYKWNRECWKCKRETPVYSYFLNYELYEHFNEYYCCENNIGLGDIKSLDIILSNAYPTIKLMDSKMTGTSYYANTCEHCGALQGKNYVVENPHEIMFELVDNKMEKYFHKTFEQIMHAQLVKEIGTKLKEVAQEYIDEE